MDTRKVIGYKLLYDKALSNLTREVEKYIESGYQPYGQVKGPVDIDDFKMAFIQEMRKYDEGKQ